MTREPQPRLPVLLVDDDIAGAELTAAILRRVDARLEVTILHDGETTADYLLNRGRFSGRARPLPVVVFLDLNMPRFDGHEVLQQIRREPALASVRVVILTSSDSPADVARSHELGCDVHLVKPVAVEDLIARLNAIRHLWEANPTH